MKKVLIEKTSKPIKAQLLLGQVLVTIGVALLFASPFIGAWALIPVAFLIPLGILKTTVANVERWWQHE